MADAPVAVIDARGITKPDFWAFFNWTVAEYKRIYGSDIYVEPDSQDGQMLAIWAAGGNDANDMAVAIYNSFRPDYAQGAGLSSVVKINGIQRKTPSYSTVELQIVGEAGTVIPAGSVVLDDRRHEWRLNQDVTIPLSGEAFVGATCSTLGAIRAAPRTITTIGDGVIGWQEVANLAEAAPGAEIETDVQLRRRQTISTMLPARSILDGLNGGIASIYGVQRMRVYENDLGIDAFGIPAHSIAAVVEGGDSYDIARVLMNKKGSGVGTFGTTSVLVPDAANVPKRIFFSRPRAVPVSWYIELVAHPGYTKPIEKRLVQALVDWTNDLGIGNPVILPEARLPIQLYGDPDEKTYRVTSVKVARDRDIGGLADLDMAFDEVAQCYPEYVHLTARF